MDMHGWAIVEGGEVVSASVYHIEDEAREMLDPTRPQSVEPIRARREGLGLHVEILDKR